MMQQITSILKYLADTNAINFVIMLVILGLIIKKIDLQKSFNSSIKNVESKIIKSDGEKEAAKSAFTDAKNTIEKLPQDIVALENEAISKSKVFKEQIEESTQKTILTIQKNADRAISIEEKKISNLLTGKTITDSIELAVNNLQNLLENNPELHNKFIEESLDELDRVKL